MSASTERKNRIAAREAGTDKKMLQQQEAARKQAKSRRKWTVGGVCVALLLVLVLLLQSGFFYNHTTAVKIGGQSHSPAEVNYYYANSYFDFVNTYGGYASLFGLDTSSGAFGLRRQACNMIENGTWRDYFLQSAYGSMAQIQALCDYARAEGLELSEEDLANLDQQMAALEASAQSYGYSKADTFLAANYGTGVTTKLVRDINRNSALADLAYTHKTDSLVYSDEELETYYAGLEGSRDYYEYLSYAVAAQAAEDGSVSDAAKAEARADADAVLAAFKDGGDIEEPAERLSAAVEGALDELVTVEPSRTAGDSLDASFADWLKDAGRKAGDCTVIEGDSGFTVLVFLERDDNHYPTVSVRHILVEAEADENGEWSDAALAVAKTRAEEILAEWESGDRTEESFAALAEQYSTDSGSNTKGGLYEDIAKGQMVEEFDDFCFGGHKPGDTAIVYGSNGQYAGYHVVYFVGEGELYSNVLARNALQREALNAWITEISPEYKEGAFAWLAGK
ncbi:MAG: peptidylprolyl isomerase [Oscillospiraceae bacterium]|nr:peptidylprolyl isomerase [Oscillospiraceae bacterium]